jgi:hypothetical protein
MKTNNNTLDDPRRNDTRRHTDSHAVDSFSCVDAACDEGIAKIRAAPSELAEATVASEADFRGLFTAFLEATAIDTEETTEATALRRMPETAFSSATVAAVLVVFRGLFAAILDVTAGDTAVTTEGVCASEAALLDVTIVDTSVFAAEAVSQGDSRRGGPGSSPCSIPQTTPSASPVSPDK